MDITATEILSVINDIHMTSKFLYKRLNKIIDDGARMCTCQGESESIGTEIGKLHSHMKSLEDKVSTRDECRLSNDLKAMMKRLDELESEFQLHESGLEKMSKIDETNIKTEYVALVTFGHQTKMQVGYTDDFRNIEKELDQTKLGGPTQMFGGIILASAATWCSDHRIQLLDNGSHIFTKVILVSDGKPTEDNLIAGPDIAYSSKNEDTKAKIVQIMEILRKDHVDVFFVPVGNSDTSRLLDPLGLVAGLAIRSLDYDISDKDKVDLRSIQASARRHCDYNRNCRNVYNEISSKQLPPIGSRVRRGPDLHYKMQESNGPGTVIGHADNDHQVLVEWDADEYQNIYMYGSQGYDVLIVDEPRKLNPGDKIATGCEVVPGKDLKNADCSVRVGVVVNVNRRKKKAKVLWNNGKRDSYLYDDLQEIRVKADGDTSVCNFSVKEDSPKHAYELEPPQAMTIEEYAAKQNPKKNKNS